jgi:proteasome lid subunit RPN8/RPN11
MKSMGSPRGSGIQGPRILLSADLRTLLETWVCEAYPEESCGLLIGEKEGGEISALRLLRVVRVENLNKERAGDRYELDPAAHRKADEEARADGMEVVGIWHSHPDHPAQPSETDRQAAWEGWSYMILSVTGEGVSDVRSWRLDGDAFIEEVVEA